MTDVDAFLKINIISSLVVFVPYGNNYTLMFLHHVSMWPRLTSWCNAFSSIELIVVQVIIYHVLCDP